MHLEHLKYPIGKLKIQYPITKKMISEWREDIAFFPEKLNREVQGLTEVHLENQYRPDGWTIRQVIHHCADSHMNAMIRLKLALTEDQPTIKPYAEVRWAELTDSLTMPVAASLSILEGIHARWTCLLSHLTDIEFSRTFIHPEHGKIFRIDENTALYAWHCNHHLAHVIHAKKGGIAQADCA